MSTTFFDMGGALATRQSLSQWMKRMSMPLEAWSRRRRLTVTVLIAALVFGLGTHGWIVADLGGLEASRVAFDSATRHLADARSVLTQLPALRRVVAVAPAAQSPASWTSTDGVQLVSELATQNSVTLLSVEPGATVGVGADALRPIQITAQTDFVHLMAFLHGLSDLPVLVVPMDVTVKRHGGALTLSATLHLFSALRPIASSTAANAFVDESLDGEDEENIVFYDPFALAPMLASDDLPDASQLRLVGLLRDRTRALALLETPEGAMTAASGQQLGRERVARLDALSITLTNAANGGAGTRTLALTEAS
ncbi:MAG TPA: hypothetical protein VFE79_05690 [Paraburkholderia sp.]|jgi:Tfp pilus assembly protein PilO|nr:hypothetical protein [Paraburkholderia sp.]